MRKHLHPRPFFSKIQLALCALLLLTSGAFAQEKLQFVENDNQWDPAVLYRVPIGGGALFLERDALTYVIVDQDDLDHAHHLKHEEGNAAAYAHMIDHHAFRMKLVGSAANPVHQGENAFPYYHNYFYGQDESKWAGGVSLYEGVVYDAVYPGVDFHVFSEAGNPKYEFILEAGADPNQIAFEYSGLDMIYKDGEDLVLRTSLGELREMEPYAYQRFGAMEVQVDCHYKLVGNKLTFELPNGYDPSVELVIDPVLVGATYSGQTGSSQFGFTATYDGSGNLYGAGESFGAGFPTSVGAYSALFAGSVDMAITKFSPDASTVLFATYMGGVASDLPHSLVVDGGNLIVMGTTSSFDYPTVATSYSPTFNGIEDIVLTKFTPDGTGLVGSTFIGGSTDDGSNNSFALAPNYGDFNRGEVDLDGAGNIYVASSTLSTNFPTTPGAYQTAIGGLQDAIVFKMSPDLSTLTWSTFIGGANDDAAISLQVGSAGQVYVSGASTGNAFPTTAGVLAGTYLGGDADAFVLELSADGSSLAKSTFIGTSGQDIGYFVDLDDDGNVFVAGVAPSSFPITGAVYSNPGATQFIARLEPDFSAYTWSTLIGSGSGGFGSEMAPTAFLVDLCGNIYMGGFTDDTGMPVTADAFQPTYAGGTGDFFFFVLAPDAAFMMYGTYLGGSGWEHVDGGTSRYDKRGVLYQASCTSSTDIPTTAGAAYPASGGVGWDRVSFRFDFEFAEVLSVFSTTDSTFTGCAPLTVDFVNNSIGADAFFWDFGFMGAVSTDFEPTFTYPDTGTYTVMLIASIADSFATCAGEDTSYMTIIVHDDSLMADFILDTDCDLQEITLTNTSNIFPGTDVSWTFGDGATSTDMDPVHTYGADGTYPVTLYLLDSFACNIADTLTQTAFIYPELVAGFVHPMESCPPFDVAFINDILDPDLIYEWHFGDGGGSADISPSYTYEEPGTYDVWMVTVDSFSCNVYDTAYSTVTVYETPDAYFEYLPEEPVTQEPVYFENLTVGGVDYSWDFGDGSSSEDENPIHIFDAIGIYGVCLTATNALGCFSDYCIELPVNADLILPNAFTPDKDGLNDIFMPLADEGLRDYHLVVYSRWGEILFESFDQNEGWDGTFQGEEQELGTYVYVLTVSDLQGREIVEPGTVTLVR